MVYTFTNNWFNSLHENLFREHIKPEGKINILEIGCFEGRSSTWLIDNYLHHPDSRITLIDPHSVSDITSPVKVETYDIFQNNIKNSKYPDKVTYHRATLINMIGELLKQEKFDFIYIDGSHLAADVFLDCALSHQLIKSGGQIWFDDYATPETEGMPRIAIDSFIKCHGSSYEKLHVGWILGLRRR